MFRPDDTRDVWDFANLINVRANKDSLQWCIFKIEDNGGYRILNEGTLPIGEVMSFILPIVKVKKLSSKLRGEK